MSNPMPTGASPLPVKIVRPQSADYIKRSLTLLPTGVGLLFLRAWLVMLIAGSIGLTQFGYWDVLLILLAIGMATPSRYGPSWWTWKNGQDK